MHSFVITYDIPEHCLPTCEADLLDITEKMKSLPIELDLTWIRAEKLIQLKA